MGFRSASPRAIGAAIKDSELRRIRRKRFALFGHAAHMEPGVPAHDALWTALYIGVNCGSAPQAGSKQPCECPSTTWAEHIKRNLDGMGLLDAWYLALAMDKLSSLQASAVHTRDR